MNLITKGLYESVFIIILSHMQAGAQEYHDITTNPEYGCSWRSGSVFCLCRDVQEGVIIEENSIPSYDTSSITFEKCRRVTFKKNSISNMRNLRLIHLKNIPFLYFEEESLRWHGNIIKQPVAYDEQFDISIPSLKVIVEDSHILKIASYAFSGRINEISFNNITIDTISSFAFSNLLQTEIMRIENTEIKNIQLQAFKRFSLEYLEIVGLKTSLIPSRAFADITVRKSFTISNSTLGELRSDGFTINDPEMTEINYNRIEHLDGEAFKIATRGHVYLKHNIFHTVNDGAFSGIHTSKDSVENVFITFDSNVFSSLTRESLAVSNLKPNYIDLKTNEKCDCVNIEHKMKDIEFYTEISCLYNNTYTKVSEFRSYNCSITSGFFIVIIIVSIVCILCIILGTFFAIYFKKIYRSKKYGRTKYTKNNQLSLIVPDGRTYRETELHMIVQRTDLLTTDL